MGSCESTFLFQITLNTVGIRAAMNYAYNNTMKCNGFSLPEIKCCKMRKIVIPNENDSY